MKNNAGFMGTAKTAASGMNGAAGGMWKLNEVAEMNQPNSLVAPTWPLPFVPPIEIWDDTVIYSRMDSSSPHDYKSSTTVNNTSMAFRNNSRSNQDQGKYGTGCLRCAGGSRYIWYLRFTALPTTATYECWIAQDGNDTDFGNIDGRLFMTIGGAITLALNGGNGSSNTISCKVGSTVIGTTGTFAANDFRHLAIVVQGTTTRFYENGVQKGSGTSPTSYSDDYIFLGGNSSTSAAKFELDDFVMTNIARYPDGTSFTPPDEHPTFNTTNPVIRALYDGSNTYLEYAVVQLFGIPTGADGYKITIGGDEDGSQPVYSGVTYYIHNPTNNQSFSTSGMSSPNTRGNLRTGVELVIKIQIDHGVHYLWIYAPNDNGASAVTCTVQAIDSANATVGNASNTLTGLRIDEDG